MGKHTITNVNEAANEFEFGQIIADQLDRPAALSSIIAILRWNGYHLGAPEHFEVAIEMAGFRINRDGRYTTVSR